MKALGFVVGDENKAQKLISRIAAGSQNISAEELYKISRYFNRSIYYFLEETENSEPDDLQSSCPISCDSELREWCKKVKRIIKSESMFTDLLKSNILAFDKGIDLEKRLVNLEKTKGNQSDIQIKARSIG